MIELNGKIVPVRINYAASLTQFSEGGYRVRAGFYDGAGAMESEYFFLPSEGKPVFERIQKQEPYGGSGETVYVHVRSDPPFRAGNFSFFAEVVGLRYRSDGKTYKW